MLTAGLALAAALATLATLATLAPRLPRLRDRYYSMALQPITGTPAGNTASTPLDAALHRWTMDGAGSGATLSPWRFPAVPCPLACAVISPTQRAAVHTFGYRLAGYQQLDTRSRLGGIVYRVGVQLRPLLWFLPRRDDEPWDDAWLTDIDAPRLAALAGWQPRRPTLIVLDTPQQGVAPRVIDTLHANLQRNGFRHPVRVLVLGDIARDELPPALRDNLHMLADQRNG